MKVTESPYSIIFLDGQGRTREQQGRSPGVHQSDILRDLANRLLHKRTRSTPIDQLQGEDLERMQNVTDMGFLFEQALEDSEDMRRVIIPAEALELAHKYRMWIRRGLAYNIDRQQEICCEGIYQSPDGLNLDQMRLEEYKLTYRSMGKFAGGAALRGEFIEWAWQMMGYCRGLGVTSVNLIACWANGAYKTYQPVSKLYEIEFEPEEIAHNWRMILGHRELMKREGMIK